MRRDEAGVASFEFVLIVPVYFMLFLASFETAMLMTRQVLLDRGMDMALRIVRLNTATPPQYEQLRSMVCQGAGLIPNCLNAVKIEMWQQDPRGTMNFKAVPDCIDREKAVDPASVYEPGGSNEVMFVRACVQYKPFFPTATMGTALVNAAGEYALVSTSIFVAEPSI
ncbi:MAG: TadE/TadG family type IV pilus assembly protein [Pseudomonadota bacterium]